MRRNSIVKQLFFLLLCAALLLPLAQAGAEGAAVTGTVWLDKPADGVFDNEPGVKDVIVILEEKTENGEQEIARATTPKSGEFAFAAPGSGEYRLRMELPAKWRFSLHGKDSAALPAQGTKSYTPWFHLDEGGETVVNIGATKHQAKMTFMVFEDKDRNGGRASAEPRLKGVLVEVLYDLDGESIVVASTLTPVGGRITIGEISPGAYRVRVTLPSGYEVGPLGAKFSGWYNCLTQDTDSTGVTVPFFADVDANTWVGAGLVRK